LPLHTRHRAIVAVLNEILGLHNKPRLRCIQRNKLTGPKEEEEKEEEDEKEEEEEEEEKKEKKKKKKLYPRNFF